jgi:glycosyltransferase involved in cell wall biosynthesis
MPVLLAAAGAEQEVTPPGDAPVLSVIIIAQNDETTIARSVAAVVNQECPEPFEVIVVTSGQDRTAAIVREHFPSVTLVDLPRPALPGEARNAGLRLADTPLVLCLDADDRLAPGALAALSAALEENPDAGFAYGHIRMVGAMGGVMRLPPYDPLKLLDRHLIGPSALMRAEVFRDTGGYDRAFALYEDWELWVAALARGWRGVRVDQVTHEYRRHAGSKLGRDRRRYGEYRRQLRAKHASLYARRAELGRESGMSFAERALYRFYWGPRPVPAAVEDALYRRVFRPR